MIREGTQVRWNWGNGTGTGKVQETFHETVTRRIKGEEITRKGSRDNPAYLIRQEDGTRLLKLKSEVERA
ncbi:hypothetical protein OB2597_00065 [Pseudooceanicola batsensis HTCC2597]|uniref:Hypervirulence associated protein TUDOR domain-containing protein n=1 Tax=Pseudooceanicola batsensis (strain ATCC BAA-863 / DSM 15984 / KCTC 12145 / HTCC2597) TaxID=252305 RepID=A3U461_PSEBH|nr:DUF2945 domain-containing protein [Pseudooceanicola batsensis]EAQ01048.1 hypothetical protein OB2597_00065 [Pseudooceanicola batsensis HTCC2597]